MRKYNTTARYAVYDNRTDVPLIVGGTSKECAAAMGIKRASFYCVKSPNKYVGKKKRWTIFRMEDEE